jgi:CDP-glucose 4,6-dehydratase
LLQEGQKYAQAWNFGPREQKGVSAQALAEKLISYGGSGSWTHEDVDLPKVETGMLRLSWEKAAALLGWRPTYRWDEALSTIAAWYKSYESNQNMNDVCVQHIHSYVDYARQQDIEWSI